MAKRRGQDLLDPNPYAFHMFENFNLNRKLFVQEQNLVIKLHQLSTQLSDLRENIYNHLLEHYEVNKDRLAFINGISPRKCDISSEIKKAKNTSAKYDFLNSVYYAFILLKKSNENIFVTTDSDFPQRLDYEGAVKAMVILHSTYNFDLTQTTSSLSSKTGTLYANISYYEPMHSKVITILARESLNHEDFLVFAQMASEYFYFYDSAIDFIAQAFRLYDETSSNTTLAAMTKLRNEILRLHNSYLLQRKTIAGKGFCVYPFIINEKLEEIYTNITYQGRIFI